MPASYQFIRNPNGGFGPPQGFTAIAGSEGGDPQYAGQYRDPFGRVFKVTGNPAGLRNSPFTYLEQVGGPELGSGGQIITPSERNLPNLNALGSGESIYDLLNRLGYQRGANLGFGEFLPPGVPRSPFGPLINTGQGWQLQDITFNRPGEGFFTPSILSNALEDLKSRVAEITGKLPTTGRLPGSGGAIRPPSGTAGAVGTAAPGVSGVGGGVGGGALPVNPAERDALAKALAYGSLNPSASAEVSSFDSLLGSLRKTFEGLREPTRPSFETQFRSLRESEGLNAAESELVNAQSTLRGLENDILTQADKIKGELVSSAVINKQLVKLDADTANALREARIAVQGAQDLVEVRTKTVSTLMELKRQDFQSARQEYEFEFNKAISVYNLFSQKQNRNEDNARANSQIIINAIKDNPRLLDNLSPDTLRNWNSIELQSGLPVGTIYNIARAAPAGIKFDYIHTSYDQSGGEVVSFFGRDANGNPRIIRQVPTGGRRAGGIGELAPSQISAAFKLADDYEQASKTFVSLTDSYNRIAASSKDPSAAGDLSLIFAYMKMLDPTSVVREGEFATAQNTGSIPQNIWSRYNRVTTGERLSPSIRADFVDRSNKLYQAAISQQRQTDQRFLERGQRFGIPAEYYMRDLISTQLPGISAPSKQPFYIQVGDQIIDLSQFER